MTYIKTVHTSVCTVFFIVYLTFILLTNRGKMCYDCLYIKYTCFYHKDVHAAEVCMDTSSFVVVSTDVLPDIFPKVLEVKRMLACGEEKSSASACKRVGISRSAFYKYRECVFAYEEKLTQKIISYYALLKDEPGVLSSILSELHKREANIITVNQNMPIDGVAAVNITVRLFGDASGAYELKNILSSLNGVVDVKFISGE